LRLPAQGVAASRAIVVFVARTNASKNQPLRVSPRVGLVLRDASRSIVRKLRGDLEAFDLNITQYLLLRDVAESPGVNQRIVSKNIDVAQPALVAVIAAMEERGLIERVRSERDRRNVSLYITKEGRALMRRALRHIETLNDIAVAGMTKDEAATLLRLLLRVQRNLEHAIADDEALS
jgi:MarR family transcriptional regulator, organic hydroperoxide resistance regulator